MSEYEGKPIKIKIEKNIPLENHNTHPESLASKLKDQISVMKVGDSFLYKARENYSECESVRMAFKLNGFRTTMRTIKKWRTHKCWEFRFWRIG